MRRNLLSASHIVLFGATLLTLAGCVDMKESNWKITPKSPPSATETPSMGPSAPPPSASAEPATLQPQKQAKIALLLPLTGKGSDTGQAMLNAAQLAMFDLNATNVFELLPEDTGQGTRAVLTDAMGKGANMVIGPVFSTDTKLAAPVALQSGINIVSFSTDTSAAAGNTFLMGFMPQTQVASVLDYAAQSGLKHIALIAPRDTYGDSVAATYATFLQRSGSITSGLIRYTPNSLPSEADLAALKAGADAVLIAASGADSNKISNALTSIGLPPATLRRLGTGLWDQPDVARLSGLQGAWYAAASPRLRTRFEKRYQDTYGAQPPRLASLAYDATALAVVLAKTGNGFGRDSLTNPNGFAGVDGIFRFTADGLADRGLAILEIKDGSPRILRDAPQRFTGYSSQN